MYLCDFGYIGLLCLECDEKHFNFDLIFKPRIFQLGGFLFWYHRWSKSAKVLCTHFVVM